MKDPEWPVYYFSRPAEGKHCCHQTQTDVRWAADVLGLLPAACCVPARPILWEEDVAGSIKKEERLIIVHIIGSGLVFKNWTS